MTARLAARTVSDVPYHHGNLHQALVDTATELARTGGPDAVVLRAVSRGAGVSHNAAYRHFADRDDLLAAVRARCLGQLAARMAATQAAVPARADPQATAWARLQAAGRAYVAFALDEPGWFRTAFGAPHSATPALPADGDPYGILSGALDELVRVGALPEQRRPAAEYAAWSAVHGLASLLVDGPLRDLPGPERDAALDRVIATVSAGL